MSDRSPAPSGPDAFDSLVAPAIFSDAPGEASPELCFVASGSVSGRSRAISSARPQSALLNARDFELLARRLDPRGETEPSAVATEWLQRSLSLAREQKTSVALEGRFRSPDLLSGLSQMFARAGFRTRLIVVAERASEVRISDASRRFDALRRRAAPVAPGGWEPVDVAGIVAATPADRVTVLDRTGALVLDAERGTSEFEGARSAFEEAAAARLGTLRSTLWLSQLHRMTRFVGERPSRPGWVLDELIALHKIALEDIVPGLAVSARSDTRPVQELRLTATLAALQNHRNAEFPDSGGLVLPDSGPSVSPPVRNPVRGIGR